MNLIGAGNAQTTDVQRQREYERENHEIAVRLTKSGLPDVAKAYHRAADAHGECAATLENIESSQGASIPLAHATRGEDACRLVEMPGGFLGVSAIGHIATVIARPKDGKIVSDESVAPQMGPSWPTVQEWVDHWEDQLRRGGWAVTRYLMSSRSYREADWGAAWPAVTEVQLVAMARAVLDRTTFAEADALDDILWDWMYGEDSLRRGPCVCTHSTGGVLRLHDLAAILVDEPAEGVRDEPGAVVLVQVGMDPGAHVIRRRGAIRLQTVSPVVHAFRPKTAQGCARAPQERSGRARWHPTTTRRL